MKNKPVFAIVIGFLILVVVLLGVSQWLGKKEDIHVKLASGTMSKNDIEEVVRDYITNNPQIIVDSVNNYQRSKRDEEKKRTEDYLKSNFDKITSNPNDPRVGNPKAKVKIVEIFDYQCGYCKKMMPIKDQIIASGEDVEIVFKEFPILGEFSDMAARAALAVYYIDHAKYINFHREMLSHNGSRNQETINKVLEKVGISQDRYHEMLKDPRIDQTINEVRGLATAAGVMGTPAYIVDGKFFPGAISYEEIMQEVERSKKAK